MPGWNLFISHTSYIRGGVSFMPSGNLFSDIWFSRVYAMPRGIYVYRNEWNNRVSVQRVSTGYIFNERCVNVYAMPNGNLFKFHGGSSFMYTMSR
jgi:hypothetical protein